MKLSKTQVITAAIVLIEKEYAQHVAAQHKEKNDVLANAEAEFTESKEFQTLTEVFGKGTRSSSHIYENYPRALGPEPDRAVTFTGRIGYKFSKNGVSVEVEKQIHQKCPFKAMTVLGIALGTTHWQRSLREAMRHEIQKAEVAALIDSKEFRLNLQAFMNSIGVKIKLPQLSAA